MASLTSSVSSSSSSTSSTASPQQPAATALPPDLKEHMERAAIYLNPATLFKKSRGIAFNAIRLLATKNPDPETQKQIEQIQELDFLLFSKSISNIAREFIQFPNTTQRTFIHPQKDEFSPEKENVVATLRNELPFVSDALIFIDLSRIGLFKIPPEIGQFQRAKTLNLSSNNLTSLPKELQNLSSLESLDVRDNFLNELPEWMQNFRGLKKLNCSENMIKEIQDWINKFKHLEEVNFEGNNLEKLPESLNSPSLKELCLSNNNLTKMPILITPHLHTLHLDGNRLEDLNPSVYTLPKLEFLWLARNTISLLPQIEPAFALKYCDLSDNPCMEKELPAWCVAPEGAERDSCWRVDEEKESTPHPTKSEKPLSPSRRGERRVRNLSSSSESEDSPPPQPSRGQKRVRPFSPPSDSD